MTVGTRNVKSSSVRLHGKILRWIFQNSFRVNDNVFNNQSVNNSLINKWTLIVRHVFNDLFLSFQKFKVGSELNVKLIPICCCNLSSLEDLSYE